MILSTKIQLFSLACAIGLVYWFIQSSSAIPSVQWNTECDATTTATHKSNSIVPFIDLNQNNTAPQTNSTYKDHILILTPFKQSAQFIDQFFDNVNRLTYPHNLISLGFLVSDSTDGTIEKLRDKAAQANRLDEWRRFEKISIFQKDYKFELASNEDRHAFEVQVKRRNIMAKSRNTLLSSALTELHDWVLWLDSDVVDYPETILEELIGIDKDIIVPNCYWHSYNEEGGYDKNNWQETDESWDFQKSLSPEDVLVEGYPEVETHRKLMIDMRNENGQTDLFYSVPLDGVGGTCTMVRANIHRDGAIFPPFPFQHQVETEGLAKMAKALGYEVWGLPNYLVYHYI